ncbi:hypothetical protein ACFY8C_28895 [Streptomyces flavochromogenes]|uniref:Uncharacterized protein n=1 Tax=Streptomyces flavochromogenes TaxID=68199 RepID=A0ABW6XXT9_9ACTN|nr:hypothetical protein [Streptomyces flavochromogenes]
MSTTRRRLAIGMAATLAVVTLSGAAGAYVVATAPQGRRARPGP